MNRKIFSRVAINDLLLVQALDPTFVIQESVANGFHLFTIQALEKTKIFDLEDETLP